MVRTLQVGLSKISHPLLVYALMRRLMRPCEKKRERPAGA